MPTFVKVCGLTDVDNTKMVVDCQVDAIGLNFYPKSKRFVDRPTAKLLRTVIPDAIEVVGVFVNSPVTEVVQTAKDVKLTAIQFHGDESVEQILSVQQQCPTLKVLRAFRLSESNFEDAVAMVSQLEDAGVSLSAVLVDAFVEGEFGGTGHRLDDTLLRRLPTDWPSLIVAGGLNADNVADCISTVRPWGVDVASGVEAEPGVKSLDKTQRFIEAVRSPR